MIAARRLRFPFFLLFWSVVLGVSFFIIRSSQFAVHPDLQSAAVTLVMVILVPLVYLVLARRMGWRLLSAIPILVLLLIAANLLIPQDHLRASRTVEMLLAPFELVLITFLVLKVRSVRKAYRKSRGTAGDFMETLEKILGQTVDAGRPGKLIATEVAMIYYGLFAWRRKPVNRPDTTSFTYHRNCGHGTIMGVFVFLVLVETGLLHWYLLPRVAPLAWVVFALSIYSVVFLFADLNATRLRPIFIDGSDLVVRVALRWRARFPLACITRVEATTHDIENKEGPLQAFFVACVTCGLPRDERLRSPLAADTYFMYVEEAKCRQVYASATEFHSICGGVHQPAFLTSSRRSWKASFTSSAGRAEASPPGRRRSSR